MKRLSKQAGFSLIELMIAIAIVGILATIALPAYNNYVTKAALAEAITMAGSCKKSVTQYYAVTGAFPTNAGIAGCANSGNSKYVGDIGVDGANSRIYVGLRDIPGISTGKNEIVFRPQISGTPSEITQWDCAALTSNIDKTIPQLLPKNCIPTAVN